MQTLRRFWWVAGLGIAAIIVIVLAPLASPDPDGLESVAGSQGFFQNAHETLYSIIPDYSVPGIDGPVISTIAAGLIGIVAVFAVMWLLGRTLAKRKA